jgi:hypothetical protein
VFVPIVIALVIGTLGWWIGAGEGLTAAFTRAAAEPEMEGRAPSYTESDNRGPFLSPDAEGLPRVTGFANVAGLGVTGTVEGRAVVVGRAQLMRHRELALPDEVRRAAGTAEAAWRRSC